MDVIFVAKSIILTLVYLSITSGFLVSRKFILSSLPWIDKLNFWNKHLSQIVLACWCLSGQVNVELSCPRGKLEFKSDIILCLR